MQGHSDELRKTQGTTWSAPLFPRAPAEKEPWLWHDVETEEAANTEAEHDNIDHVFPGTGISAQQDW